MLGLTLANCRQLFHRALAHIAERRRRFQPAPELRQRLLARFCRLVSSAVQPALHRRYGRIPACLGRRPVVSSARTSAAAAGNLLHLLNHAYDALISHATLGYWLADTGPLLVLTLALLLVSAGWLDRGEPE